MFGLVRGVFRHATFNVGPWRSLVARFTGGEEVVGSNPAGPTTTQPSLGNHLLAMTGIKIFSGRPQHVEKHATQWIEDQHGTIEVISISQSAYTDFGIALTILYQKTNG